MHGHSNPHTMMHHSSGRLMPRPDFARSQTIPRGPYPAPPHGPMYPDHSHYDRAYPPSGNAPTYARQHHSYYDERGPVPPPPMHHRHMTKEEAHYSGYDARPQMQPLRSSHYDSIHHQTHQHVRSYPHHQHPHHAPFSSSSPSSSSMHPLRASMGNMAMPTGSHQQPTYRGHIKTTKDAILLLGACDLNDDAGGPALPPPRRVTRRLLDSERADLICSGSIFVWDEKEAGMRRWTDGKCWSASRVSGCFLTYRELEARKKPSSSITGGPTSNLYKAEGLIKQSFSMTTTSGRKLHVISYYTKRDVREGLLRRVSEDPRFVGEGGGEWGLEVDEHEYPDPISRAGDLPPGVEPDDLEGSQSPPAMPLPHPHSRPHPEDLARMPARKEPESDERGYYDQKVMRTPISPIHGHRSERNPISPKGRPDSPEDGKSMYTHRRHDAQAKDVSRSRFPYNTEVTPLHEAKGLLPIGPIPVDSEFAAEQHALRRSSDDYASGQSAFHAAQDSASLYNRKRALGDPRGPGAHDDGDVDVKSARPRLQRLRSSSMSNNTEEALAPMRPLGRAGSNDDGVSQLRSTNSGQQGFKERDSAVGALLSLRSSTGSAGDDASVSNPSIGTMFTRSPSASTPGTAESGEAQGKPTFSRIDRAALDRFSIRI